MGYNAEYDSDFKGYNKQDDTIATDIKELEDVWAIRWVGNSVRKYADVLESYIIKCESL